MSCLNMSCTNTIADPFTRELLIKFIKDLLKRGILTVDDKSRIESAVHKVLCWREFKIGEHEALVAFHELIFALNLSELYDEVGICKIWDLTDTYPETKINCWDKPGDKNYQVRRSSNVEYGTLYPEYIQKKKELFDAYHEKNVSLTAEILTEHNYILKEGGLFGSNPEINVIADWTENTYNANKTDHYNN